MQRQSGAWILLLSLVVAASTQAAERVPLELRLVHREERSLSLDRPGGPHLRAGTLVDHGLIALSVFDVAFDVPDYGTATTSVLFTVEVDRSQALVTAELGLGSRFGVGPSYESELLGSGSFQSRLDGPLNFVVRGDNPPSRSAIIPFVPRDTVTMELGLRITLMLDTGESGGGSVSFRADALRPTPVPEPSSGALVAPVALTWLASRVRTKH
jgi:hypothetical protein